MNSSASSTGSPAVRRITDLALTAWNASRLLTGARLTDVVRHHSLPADVEASLQDARAQHGVPPEWSVSNRLSTVADVAVIELREGPQLAAVLKLARSPSGEAILKSQQQTLQSLAADSRLGDWRRLLPEVLAYGMIDRRTYSIEKAVSGTVGAALRDSAVTPDTYQNAASVIAELHRATGRATVISRPLLDRWLEPALALVGDVPMLLGAARRRDLIEGVRERIRAGVEGRTLWLSRTHGDYALGNIFFDLSADVRGIIDWGQSREDDFALIDPMTLLLVGQARAQGKELGRVVWELCRGASLSAEGLATLEQLRATCPADPVDLQVMVILAWLRHLENNLLKSPRYRTNPVWVYGTLETVLKVAGGPGT